MSLPLFLTFDPFHDWLVTDSPVTIVTPLKETTCIEGDTVTLEAECNKPDVDGVWFKDNLELAPDEKFEPFVEGVTQGLTIHDVELEDEAEYSIEVPGDSSAATLWVEGLYSHHAFSKPPQILIPCKQLIP